MTPARETLEQAIDWMAVVGDESATPAERAAFAAWLAADPRHGQAWAQVQGHVRQALGAPGMAQRMALQAPRAGRRQLLRGALTLAGVGAGALLLGSTGMPFGEWTADLRSGTGQRLRQRLADGSQVQLDALSALDIDYASSLRRLTLRRGKLLVEVAREARPLAVCTPHGSVSTREGRLMVALGEQATHAWVLEGEAQVRTLDGLARQVVAGQGVRLAGQIEPLPANRRSEANWQDGWLEVLDWPLGDVVEALRPYRRGVLRVSPQATRMRVSGVFSLDHSERALTALEQTMPLRINRYLDWWVSIEVA